MKAGLQVGDIITAIGKSEIDQNGNYVDPLYGKIEFTNLLNTHAFAGGYHPVSDPAQGQTDAVKRHARASRRERLRHPALQL